MRRTAFSRKMPPARLATQWGADTLPSPRAPCAEVRATDKRARLTVPIPKARPARDEPYRRRVAALPCIHCGIEGYSQAAHGPTLGRGIKASDLETFPLCAARPGAEGCHAAFDQYRLFPAEQRIKVARKWAAATARRLCQENPAP